MIQIQAAIAFQCNKTLLRIKPSGSPAEITRRKFSVLKVSYENYAT